MRYEDFEFLLCEPQDDGVMLVTLNRPDAMNATNDRMHWELDPDLGRRQRRRIHLTVTRTVDGLTG